MMAPGVRDDGSLRWLCVRSASLALAEEWAGGVDGARDDGVLQGYGVELLPDAVTDSELEAKLYKNAGTKQGHRRHAEPDWAGIRRELRRKHVTLSILWDEYIEQRPDGYRYSRFCELYRAWEGKLSVTMRQAHAGGDKLFVDYAGDTAP